MITLITGGPGTGKTAWTLNQVVALRENEKKTPNEPKKILFIHGIRNLRGIQHTQIFCKSQLCDICRAQDSKLDSSTKYVENWQEWKVPNSLIIIDEVQRIWRPRGGTGTPPEDISLLETHRHYGVDFWLISQGPHLFDNFIRLLVGRHVHLVSKWSGRYEYEWPECKQNVQSRTDAVERPYKLPKRVYSLYDSAEVHTKQTKRIPLAVYGLVVAVLFFLGMAYIVYSRFSDRLATIDESSQDMQHPDEKLKQSGNSPGNNKKPATVEKQAIPMETPQDIQTAFSPIVPSLPWTAPIYKEQAKPVNYPVIKGCIKIDEPGGRKLCNCYTQQATIVDMPPIICEQYVKTRIFNPFKPDKPDIQQDYNQYANNDSNTTTRTYKAPPIITKAKTNNPKEQ